MNKVKYIIPSVMYAFGAVTFLLQYASRVATGGMIDRIMAEFSIGATMAGHIGSAFYYSYIAMQLFVGRVADKYPAHRVLMVTLLVFLLANQLFSEAVTIQEAFVARILMGAMGAFTFVVTMKLALLWFEGKYLGVLSGLTQVSGMLGVVFGNYVVDIMLIGSSWRLAIKVFSSLMLALLVLMIVFMKEKPQMEKAETISIIDGLARVLGNKQSWYNALFAGLIYLPTAAFGEYWGIQYLTKTNTMIDKHQAVVAINMIFMGWAIGGIWMGWFSDYLKKRKPLLLVTPIVCLVLLAPVLFWHQMPAWLMNVMLFAYGFSNSGLVISYAISGEINDVRVSGVSIAFCNMMSIALGSIALPLVGFIVDYYSQTILAVSAYEKAVLIFPFTLIAAFLIAMHVEETHCTRFNK